MKPFRALLSVISFTIVLIMLLTSTFSAVQAKVLLTGE